MDTKTELEAWLAERDADSCRMVPIHRAAIRLLPDDEWHRRSAALAGRGLRHGSGSCGCLPGGIFRRERVLNESDVNRQTDPDRGCRKWLYANGVPFRTPVCVFYYDRRPVEMTWKLLIRYVPLIFQSPHRDEAVVTDHTYQWALSFCHDGPWVFGHNG